ncbi:CheY-like receiver [Candidatus Terasakiella magnetica]|nr:CheY-like receiver [Candidatus Terasakiella magnetica]
MKIDVDLSHITALIIDDSRYARSYIKTALQSFGISTILEASDGPLGLELLGSHAIQLIVTDHDMSPMNGIDFTRYVRSGDMVKCVDVAIIMMSGEAAKEVVFEARNAGVSEFLVKPVSADSLFRRVRAALLNPKAFVQSPAYAGPDRRALSRPPPGVAERRMAPPLPKPAPLATLITAGTAPASAPATGASGPVLRPAAAERTGRRKFTPGQVIFHEGEHGLEAYVVESGKVGIFKTVDSQRVILGRIGINGVFGEMALIDDEPRMASAMALEDTTCLVLPIGALKAQIGKTPDLVILVLETLLHDIRKMGRELGQVRGALERKRASG